MVYQLFNPLPHHVLDELLEKLPDFKRGYLDDGVKAYEDLAPVVFFRSSFFKSWQRVLNLAKQSRQA